MKNPFKNLRFSLLIVIVFFTASCGTIQENPISGNKRAMAYTWEQELQLGSEADPQVVAQFGLYEDEDVANYVLKISKDILQYSHMRRETTSQQFRDTPFTFRVLNSDVVNAFALPGGYIYVTRGLLTHLNNEAQLAVVIGHEIVHVAARHASQRGIQQQLGSILLIGGAVIGQEVFGASAENILNIGGTAAQLLFLSYSRANETESDVNGVEYAAMAGYDASQAAGFFRTLSRLSEASGASIPNHLSSHPDPGNREQNMIRLSQRWKERGYEQTKVNTNRYLEMIDGMIVGENPREGFVRNNMFYHPDLEFQYPIPAGWQVMNMPTQVVAFDESQSGISIFGFAQGAENVRQAVEEFTNQEGITVVSSGANNINGKNGYQAIARATSNGNQLQIMIQAIQHGEYIFRFLNYTTQAGYSNYESSFNQIVNGFDTLTNSEILAINPVRIQIVEATRSGRFSTFIPNNLPDGFDADKIAILNQLYLDDMVTIGQKLKIPVQ